MRQKHLNEAIRCSLENFALLETTNKQASDTPKKFAKGKKLQKMFCIIKNNPYLCPKRAKK